MSGVRRTQIRFQPPHLRDTLSTPCGERGRPVELSQSRLLAARTKNDGRALTITGAARDGTVESDLQDRYAHQPAATACAQLPWAAATFIATYGAVAVFELFLHPERLGIYVTILCLGAFECLLAVVLTRSPTLSPARCLLITT